MSSWVLEALAARFERPRLASSKASALQIRL